MDGIECGDFFYQLVLRPLYKVLVYWISSLAVFCGSMIFFPKLNPLFVVLQKFSANHYFLLSKTSKINSLLGIIIISLRIVFWNDWFQFWSSLYWGALVPYSCKEIFSLWLGWGKVVWREWEFWECARTHICVCVCERENAVVLVQGQLLIEVYGYCMFRFLSLLGKRFWTSNALKPLFFFIVKISCGVCLSHIIFS